MIGQKRIGVLGVSLADTVGDDRLQVRVDTEDVLIPDISGIGRLHLPLLLRDVRPKLVEFEPVHLHKLHQLIVYGGATLADADAKAS